MAKNKTDYPLNNPLTSHLGYQLRRASNAMIVDLSEKLGKLDLTVVKGSILLLIESNPNITQIKIARALAIKRANMAPLIACLERLELISRTRVDGRSQGLNLTEKGVSLTAEVLAIMNAHEAKFASRLSDSLVSQIQQELSLIWDEQP